MRAPRSDARVFGAEFEVEAIEFVGWAGREQEVEIWQVRHIYQPDEPQRHMLAGYDRKRNQWIGTFDLEVAEVFKNGEPEMPESCMKDLARFARTRGVSKDRVLRVHGAALVGGYKGRGIGGAMYAASAALALKMGLALAADACFYSATSESARRVWSKSTVFREHATVGASHLLAVANAP